jgi:ligand-binding SRPBCC domain-containing protein
MKPIRKTFTLTVPRPLEEVWNFFSRPENLNELTPGDMSFNILSPIKGVEMYPGMVIQYEVRPIMNIPMNWITEITQIRKHEFFIDDQRVGPYSLWHHQHHFKEVEGGTEMTDILHYQVPFGPIGSFANWLFVERQVDQIFEYREEAVQKLFAK